MKYLFVDTNILLHFKTFNEIKWREIVKDNFSLVICRIILDEIDKHKYNNNPRTARRAKMITDKFEQYINNPDPSLRIVFLAERPAKAFFEQAQLDLTHQDDCLLASMLQFQDEHPDDQILLISDDLGVRMRAGMLRLKTLKLEPDERLPEQLDEQTKQIEKLKNEVTQLKNHIPKLKLQFSDGGQVFTHPILKINKPLDEYIAKSMSDIKAKYEPFNLDETEETTSLAGLIRAMGNSLSNKRKMEYNNHLDEYFKDYQMYLRQNFERMVAIAKYVQLSFKLINDGNTPATDIDIWVHLPDGFSVVRDYPKQPKQPKPPYRPTSEFDFQRNPMLLPSLDFSMPGTLPTIDPNEPSIKKTNSYDVKYRCKSLKHAMANEFNSIILEYKSVDQMKNFQIDYIINAGNVPQEVKGTLSVVFKQN